MMLSKERIEANKQQIVELLQSTNRKGMDKVLAYLDGVGFYTAPSSRDRHHNWQGGLAQHSLGTCLKALKQSEGLDRSSVIIAAMLHDICKASRLYYGTDGRIHKRPTYIKGHGWRSVSLLKREGLELTSDEWAAIRWHMGLHNASYVEAGRVMSSKLWQVVFDSDKSDARNGWRKRLLSEHQL